MDIKPIRTKRDYEAALRAIVAVDGSKTQHARRRQADVLATLVEAYEAKHFPLICPIRSKLSCS